MWILICLGIFTASTAQNISSSSCQLPDCYVDKHSIPGGLSRDETPQVVTFTLTGPVTASVRSYVNQVFTSGITNPNRCPCSITVFALGKGSKKCQIHKMYVRGHEIALQGYNSSWPGSWTTREWRENTANFLSDLSQDGYVPDEALKGMRAPLQQPGGDRQFQMIKDAGLEWDSTLLGGPTNLDDKQVWPVTLTYGVETCLNSGFCPEDFYPGIWEVPLLRLAHNPVPCTYLDACVSYKDNQLTSSSKIYKALYDNFMRNYKTNRAPFQVNIRVESLKDMMQRDALKDFIHTLSGFEDVWLLSISELLAWIKTPKTSTRALEFGAWDCPDRSYKVECDDDKEGGRGSEEKESEGFEQFIDGKQAMIIQYIVLCVSFVLVLIYDRYTHPRNKD